MTLTQFSEFRPRPDGFGYRSHDGNVDDGLAEQRSCRTAALTVQGDYAKVTSFVNGLDNFPRLFVIQNFDLAYGAGAATGTTGRARHRVQPCRQARHLGRRDSDVADGRALQPVHQGVDLLHVHSNALAACTKAKTAVH